VRLEYFFLIKILELHLRQISRHDFDFGLVVKMKLYPYFYKIRRCIRFLTENGIHYLKTVSLSGKNPQENAREINKKKFRTGVSGASEGSRGNRPGGLLLV